MSIAFLKPRKARPFFGHHPWVFDTALSRITGNPQPGDAIELRTDKDEFVGHGLFNPNSKIRIRLYSWDQQKPIDGEMIASRIERAVRFRHERLGLSGEKQACRLFYSESDGLSGLIVDRYADVLVLQITSLALSKHLPTIVETLQRLLNPRCLFQRTEKGIGELEGLQLADGLVAGTTPEGPFLIEENGLELLVDIQTGQKTGMFLDQRDNRLALCRYTAGRDVLDVFCNTGAFSLQAMKNGSARSALAVDVSESAIEHGRRNASHNGVAIEFRAGEAVPVMKELHHQGRRFGVVVCDPPKFARASNAIDRALRGYEQINTLALNLLEPDGILMTCSCSGLIDRETFVSMLTGVSQNAGRELQILEVRGQAPDHPVSVYCQETEYLKCFIARVVE